MKRLNARSGHLLEHRDAQHDEQQEHHEEQEEQELGDAHGGAGDTAKAQGARDQGDDQENEGSLQHSASP